ncbi:MFS transporter [Sedimenticola selenatireducens]|uniref:MFS transporter n=1 Tax=Sedimenticola selenatireducens TaxID=191960 RepID=A0A2N6CRM5_9GAMM|nr:MFS transporter [Sedimenticola selenatireducens]PLX59737.1 MAG: MFS transporter [Sedimenticola selenatireducens]
MPYWRLSSFYFFYFAALGVLVPYWGLYLKSLGFNAVAIGQLMAIPMATKFIAPFVWGWLGDHLGRRMAIVRLGALLTTLIFVAVFWLQGFWELGLAMVLFSFFWNAVLPQFEAVVICYLGKAVSRYAQIRVWGSIGFIVTVVVLGMAVDLRGSAAVLPVLLSIYALLWGASLLIADPATSPHPVDQPGILSVLRKPAVLAFLTACFLLQAGHGAYYGFYSIYMEALGYSKTMIGQLWALGVIAEVAVFLVMHRLLLRLGARNVLMISLLLAALRWYLIGNFADSLVLLFFAQTLHAATFGTFHAAAIHLVHHYFTGRHQGRGQALYSSLSFGLGGALGTMSSGFLWEGAGPTLVFNLSVAVSLLGLFIVWRWVVNDRGQ